MSMNSNNDVAYDEAGFEAFFKTHPNDATVMEDVPPPEPDDADGEINSDTTTTPDTTNPNDTVGDGGAATEGADGGGQNQASTDAANADNTAQSNPKITNQQAQAFAQMRIANKQQQQLINQIAQVVGVTNTNDPNAVMSALQGLVIKAQSQKQGIPEDVLARLTMLENKDQEHQKQQAYLAAGRGFHNIKEKFGLSDDGLEAFAKELIADGLNPYEQPIDLMREFKTRHFDELIEQAVQRGIDQEAKRAAKAGTQSSTPNSTVGAQNDSELPKINSVAELNKFLEENK